MKICSRCKEDKSIDAFNRDKNKAGGRSPWCKKCQAANGLAWHKKHPGKSKETNDAYRKNNAHRILTQKRIKTYGTDGKELLKEQGGCCAICSMDLYLLPQRHRHIDHDHGTRKVRGWLCHWCNIGLGKFKDSPEKLRAAAVYLEAAKRRTT